MTSFNEKQIAQESKYDFPYHYADILSDEHRLIWSVEYLALLKIIKQLLMPFNNQYILDAGCGDGRFCYELKDEPLNVVGVDFSQRAISFARAFCFDSDIVFYAMDLETIELPHKFDYITMIEVLEHIPPEKIPKLLENLANLLKNDGKLIISVPSTNLPLLEKHYRHFNSDILRETLDKYFHITDILGFSRMGIQRQVFLILRKIGLYTFPFRKKTKLVSYIYDYMKQYFEHNLAEGIPEKCYGLIAVCEKI